MLGIVFPMLLSGNEKKEGKGRKTVFESPEKEMLAHRVQTNYSLGHLICIAILCVYICGLGLFVQYPFIYLQYILQSTIWIVKFELFMPLESKEFFFSFFFSLIRYIAMHFVSCFLRERKRMLLFFFNRDIGLWKTGKKVGSFLYVQAKKAVFNTTGNVQKATSRKTRPRPPQRIKNQRCSLNYGSDEFFNITWARVNQN